MYRSNSLSEQYLDLISLKEYLICGTRVCVALGRWTLMLTSSLTAFGHEIHDVDLKAFANNLAGRVDSLIHHGIRVLD